MKTIEEGSLFSEIPNGFGVVRCGSPDVCEWFIRCGRLFVVFGLFKFGGFHWRWYWI